MNDMLAALDDMGAEMIAIGWLLDTAASDPLVVYDDRWSNKVHLAVSEIYASGIMIFQLEAPASLSDMHYYAVLTADEMTIAAEWMQEAVNTYDFGTGTMYYFEEAVLLGEGYAEEVYSLLRSQCGF